MHIEFDISGSKLRYDAGDHVAVFPVNDAEIVEKLGARLNVDLGTIFTLTNLDGVLFVFCVFLNSLWDVHKLHVLLWLLQSISQPVSACFVCVCSNVF